jgi:hypothetical protein
MKLGVTAHLFSLSIVHFNNPKTLAWINTSTRARRFLLYISRYNSKKSKKAQLFYKK